MLDPSYVASGAVVISAASLVYTFWRNSRGDTKAAIHDRKDSESRMVRIEILLEGLQKEMARLTDILNKFTEVQSDVRNLDTRLVMVEQNINDLKRGRGYVQHSARETMEGFYVEPNKD